MGGGGGEVDVVETGTCAHHNLQLLGGVEHLSVALVGADDEGVGIFHGLEQLGLLGVFLEQHELVAGCLYFLAYALYSCSCERLLCCYKNLHNFQLSIVNCQLSIIN